MNYTPKPVKVGDEFNLRIKVGEGDAAYLKSVVGSVVERMSSNEARRRGLTKSPRTGTFLVLNVPGHGQVRRFRGQGLKPVEQEPRFTRDT